MTAKLDELNKYLLDRYGLEANIDNQEQLDILYNLYFNDEIPDELTIDRLNIECYLVFYFEFVIGDEETSGKYQQQAIKKNDLNSNYLLGATYVHIREGPEIGIYYYTLGSQQDSRCLSALIEIFYRKGHYSKVQELAQLGLDKFSKKYYFYLFKCWIKTKSYQVVEELLSLLDGISHVKIRFKLVKAYYKDGNYAQTWNNLLKLLENPSIRESLANASLKDAKPKRCYGCNFTKLVDILNRIMPIYDDLIYLVRFSHLLTEEKSKELPYRIKQALDKENDTIREWWEFFHYHEILTGEYNKMIALTLTIIKANL